MKMTVSVMERQKRTVDAYMNTNCCKEEKENMTFGVQSGIQSAEKNGCESVVMKKVSFGQYFSPVIIGIVGALSLLIVYVLLLSFANSASHVWEQFVQYWYWILLLVIGFGVQVGLFTYVRSLRMARASLATNSSVSTASMVACCAHHLTDILPIIGLSAAATFLTSYQKEFIMFGVVSNIAGIMLMLRLIRRAHSKTTAVQYKAKVAREGCCQETEEEQ